MAKAKAKKPAKKKPAKKKTAKLSAVERDVTEMLADDEHGMIDNVFDIVDELTDYNKRLPKTSPLRRAWDVFYNDCIKIMMESAEG